LWRHREIYLGRTSPVVEGLAGWVLDQALDPAARDAAPIAARCGLVRTRRVTARTTLIVARFRYHLKPRISEDLTLLCEEIVPLAFHGNAQSPQWIEGDQAETLLSARPDANLTQSLVDQQLPLLLGGLSDLQEALGKRWRLNAPPFNSRLMSACAKRCAPRPKSGSNPSCRWTSSAPICFCPCCNLSPFNKDSSIAFYLLWKDKLNRLSGRRSPMR
jgi:hypothetical protein